MVIYLSSENKIYKNFSDQFKLGYVTKWISCKLSIFCSKEFLFWIYIYDGLQTSIVSKNN